MLQALVSISALPTLSDIDTGSTLIHLYASHLPPTHNKDVWYYSYATASWWDHNIQSGKRLYSVYDPSLLYN